MAPILVRRMSMKYRKGPVGALMDEYERVTTELSQLLESISDADYNKIIDPHTPDEDCRSVATIMRHVIRAGHGYAGYMRDVWGMDRGGRWDQAVTRAEAIAMLRPMLDYMVATLEGHGEMSEKESTEMKMLTRWGVTYDFEQLFEHAIVHVMRHRRQIKRLLEATA